jgi:NAD+ kinase
MRIALFGKHIADASVPFIQDLIATLQAANCKLFVYQQLIQGAAGALQFRTTPEIFSRREEIEGSVDFLFSIGGDGTMLDAAGLVGNSGIPIAGINIGRLGFLSGISKDMIIPAFNAIEHGDFFLEERSLLQLDSPEGLFGKINFALNDITVYKPNVMAMLTIKTWINGQFLNTYWADGLIIATPTGSTAYSLSCTGPILTPDAENFLITPIASHNLTVRPIVIRDDNKIRIKVDVKNENYLVSLDSRHLSVCQSTELNISKAPFRINFLRLKEKNFFQTIREKLYWGVDNRN